ncbi:MAG: hypothetical protein Q4C74_02370 [Rothia sp. (in: high G+C Gram-positive bacteria)]|nr:hypothetical protein [Rothia sp. (in: high G+C Gram-positive bacteria)]
MSRDNLGFSLRAQTGNTPRKMALLFLLLSLICAGLWTAYRSLFQDDSSITGVLALTLLTAGFWSYLIGYSPDRHTDD